MFSSINQGPILYRSELSTLVVVTCFFQLLCPPMIWCRWLPKLLAQIETWLVDYLLYARRKQSNDLFLQGILVCPLNLLLSSCSHYFLVHFPCRFLLLFRTRYLCSGLLFLSFSLSLCVTFIHSLLLLLFRWS